MTTSQIVGVGLTVATLAFVYFIIIKKPVNNMVEELPDKKLGCQHYERACMK